MGFARVQSVLRCWDEDSCVLKNSTEFWRLSFRTLSTRRCFLFGDLGIRLDLAPGFETSVSTSFLSRNEVEQLRGIHEAIRTS